VKIVICGLSITSSWGNGHATTYRALARAFWARGHEIIFFEKDLEWYASNRDMRPPFCRVHLYEQWQDVTSLLRRELADADVAMVGSFCPDGVKAIDAVLDSAASIKAFYDIDTPITVAKLRAGDAEYLRRDQISGFDVYFSFTGGPMLQELQTKFDARRAVPLYCSFDPDRYGWREPDPRYQCDLSYMGTYAPDRHAKLEELFCTPAQELPQKGFLLAGPQYPSDVAWPKNVRRVIHLEPVFHPYFYSSSVFTLNLTRSEMVAAGYSPSVRIFEAAGCGSAIISDVWPGLETFFTPGEEILLAQSSSDVTRYLVDITPDDARKLGLRAQEHVLAEHSSKRRAVQFEEMIGAKQPLGQFA
jgi:spore maturation protein CgeB